MELTIKRIIDIDKEAENFKKNMDDLLLDKKKELEKALDQMKKDYEETISTEKRSLLQRKVEEAKLNAVALKDERQKQIEKLSENYSACRDKIVSTCFNEIINSYEEV
jgi:hypothetical protein